MNLRLLILAVTFALGAMPASAQEGQPKPDPKPKSPPDVIYAPDPRREGQPVNIKVDVVLSEQSGSEAPTKRTLAVVVSDRFSGRVRTQSDVAGVPGGVHLNIDAAPEILSNGKIRLGFNIQYDGRGTAEDLKEAARGAVVRTSMQQTLSLILENGRPMVAAQSADPIGDRKVTVEVTATILK
jgi:hypothetical protein